jgi:hypothetical protein
MSPYWIITELNYVRRERETKIIEYLKWLHQLYLKNSCFLLLDVPTIEQPPTITPIVQPIPDLNDQDTISVTSEKSTSTTNSVGKFKSKSGMLTQTCLFSTAVITLVL